MLPYTLVVLFLAALVASDDSSIGCFSSVDTSVSKGYNKFQTQSLCASLCGDSYAYVAITNGGTCYCLLSLPSTLTSDDSCNVPCNGYGSVMCGGAEAYSVFAGLGEASDASSNAAAASNADTASAGGTGAETVRASTSSLGTSSSKLSTSSGRTTSTSKSKTSSTLDNGSSITSAPSDSESMSTTVIVTRASSQNGSVVYRTITMQASATASETSHSGGGSKANTGAIVGGVVGGVAAAVLVAVGIFLFVRLRRSSDDDDEEFYEKGSGTLGRGPGTGRSKKGAAFDSALDMPMANPFAHPTDEFADKRMSKMTAGGHTDPRLNPVMVGRRRLLEGSLADETDYLRKMLAVANP